MLKSRKYSEKVLLTKRGFCVFSPFLFERNLKSFDEPNEFRDRKTRGDTDAVKQKARKLVTKYWKTYGRLSSFMRDSVEKQKKLIVKINLVELKYSLKARTTFDAPITKLEFLKEIITPFAFEIRNGTFLEWFVAEKLYRGGRDAYIRKEFFLRPSTEVIRLMTAAILFKRQPEDLRNIPRNKIPSKLRREYELTYQMVLRAYREIEIELRHCKKIEASLAKSSKR